MDQESKKGLNRATQMHTAKRTILWLAFFFICFLPAVASSMAASESRIGDIFTVGYDTPVAKVITGYDIPVCLTSLYDAAPNHHLGNENRPLEEISARFGPNAEVLAAETTAGSLEEATALQARAQELNGLRDSWMAGRGTTTAVNVQNIGTGEVQTWIATESPGAMPSQWNGLLRNGETFIQGPGHAEQTIANALGNDWMITSGGTSRNICVGTCQPLLEGQGLQLGGPVFRGMGDKTPYRMFWR